jgi:hypothetical protein
LFHDSLAERAHAQAGISLHSLEITITETPKVNWGIRGQNAADLTLNYRVEVLAVALAIVSAVGRSGRMDSMMRIFQFDRGEKVITRYDSEGLRATRVAAGDGSLDLTCLALAPGGIIGAHRAAAAQLFLVIGGDGWVAGPDGQRVPVSAGWGARWEEGEEHASGTATGMLALAVEGSPLHLHDPEAHG